MTVCDWIWGDWSFLEQGGGTGHNYLTTTGQDNPMSVRPPCLLILATLVGGLVRRLTPSPVNSSLDKNFTHTKEKRKKKNKEPCRWLVAASLFVFGCVFICLILNLLLISTTTGHHLGIKFRTGRKSSILL